MACVLALAPGGADGPVPLQEVSGLDGAMTVEAVPEGGGNRFAHSLRAPPRHRGLAPMDGALVRCCVATAAGAVSQPVTPRDMVLTLCGAAGEALMAWEIVGALPVRRRVASPGPRRGALAIGTLELAHRGLARQG
jgi:phage tail-like protein